MPLLPKLLREFIVGNRKTMRQPNEVLRSVVIPRGIENARSSFLKLGARHYLVISIVMVAVVVQPDERGCVADARVAVGSCSVTVRRLAVLEQILVGKPARSGLGSFELTIRNDSKSQSASRRF